MAKKELTEAQQPLIEAHKINYRLRSTFFYRKLHEYQTLTDDAYKEQFLAYLIGILEK